MGRPFRSKPVGTVQEVRFEDRFQNEQRRHLDHPIPNRRDSQGPLSPIGHGNMDAAHWPRLIILGLQRGLKLLQEDTGAFGFDLLKRRPVNARASFVRSYSFPRRLKHVHPADLAVEAPKTEVRLLLRFLVQLPSQRDETLGQTTVMVGCLCRSRIFVQPGEAQSTPEPQPPAFFNCLRGLRSPTAFLYLKAKAVSYRP